MALKITYSKGSAPNTMRLAAGEPIILRYTALDTNSNAQSFAARAFVLAFYNQAGEEIGYFDAEVIDNVACWTLNGAHSARFAGQNLTWDIAERLADNSRDTIVTGVLTIDRSAPRIASLAGAPIGRYTAILTRVDDPALAGPPDITVTYGPFAAAVPPVLNPVFNGTVTLTGSAVVGSTLTASTPSVTNGAISARAWLRDGQAISGATAATYTLTQADEGKAVAHRITATGAQGSTPAVITSAAVTVQAATVANPTITGAVTLTGDAIVGQTLTASSPAVSNGSITARQWLRDGQAISGATSATYKLVDADEGKAISHRVTATGATGSTPAVATSTAVTVQAAQPGVTLNRLALSAPLTRGVPATVNILNATAGSTLTGTVPGMTLDSAARTLTGTPTDLSFLLNETSGQTQRDTLMFSPPAGKHKLQLGMGVAGIIYYGTNNVFLDNLKVARINTPPATADANGMPLTLTTNGYGRTAADYIMPMPDGSVTPVKWRVITDGDIDVSVHTFNGYTERFATKEGNDLVFTYTGEQTMVAPDRNFLYFSVRAVRTPPTYLHVVRDDEADYFKSGKIFRPLFKEAMSGFKWIRMMNWAGANFLNPIPNNPNLISYEAGDVNETKVGVPFDVQVALCKELNIGGWFNLHIKDSDATFQAMWPKLDELLALGLDVYLELSNEVWNGDFAQHGYATAQGKAMGYGVENSYLANLEWNGFRAGQLAKMSRGRGYKWLIGSQPVNQDYQPDFIFRGIADSGALKSDFYGWTTTNYSSGTLTLAKNTLPAALVESQDKWNEDRNYDAAFDNVLNNPLLQGYSVKRVKQFLQAAKNVANAHGWKLFTYEGNLLHLNSIPHANAYDGLFYAMPDHPLTDPCTHTNLQTTEDVGLDGATLFDFDGRANSSGHGIFGHYGRPSFDALKRWNDNMEVVTPPVTPPANGYRYFRFKPTMNMSEAEPGGQYWRWGAGEIVFKDGSTAIPSTGFVASSPSVSSQNPVERVIDGLINVSWLTNGSDALDATKAVLTIDVGADKAINPTSVDIHHVSESAGFSFAKGTIEGSKDGTTWVMLANVTNKLTYTNGLVNIPLVAPSTGGGGGGGVEPAPDTVFAEDTFTGADGTALAAHTSDSGHSWTVDRSGATISGNQLLNSNATTQIVTGLLDATPPSGDYKVSGQFNMLSNLGSNNLVARAQDASNLYFAGFHSVFGWMIAKRKAGSGNTLVTKAASFTTGIKAIDFIVEGSRLSLVVDGVEVLSVTDTEFATGKIGVFLSSSNPAPTATTGVHIDSISGSTL